MQQTMRLHGFFHSMIDRTIAPCEAPPIASQGLLVTGWKNLYALVAFISCLCMALPSVQADALRLPGKIGNNDVKPGLPQPYIVKRGDTLWDIADYFFKDPFKWIKIWEKNLYITNPDLIYPGNKIRFNASRQQQGGLSMVHLEPQIVIKPAERLEGEVDSSLMLTALVRQDFIQPGEVNGVGHILDSEDKRIHYGVNDRLYLKMNAAAEVGDVFDVFRNSDPIHDLQSGKLTGMLVEHLGQIEITSRAQGVHRGVVIKAFEEMSRGDRLKPARVIDLHMVPNYPGGQLEGSVLYIRDDAAEAGQHQVIGISLGLKDGLKAGAALTIHRAGRMITDQLTGEEERLPEEKIGEIMVLVPQQTASIALITKSTGPINIGDAVHNAANR
jgi:hypothetical protein